MCAAGSPSYPVPGERLGPVLVDNPNVPWRLDPGLSVHLHRHALIPQDGDLHRATLSKHHSRHRAAPRSPQVLSAPQAPSCPTHPCPGRLTPGVTPYPPQPLGSEHPRLGRSSWSPAVCPTPLPLPCTQHRLRDRSAGNSVLRHQHQAQGGDTRPPRAAGSLGMWGHSQDRANTQQVLLFSTKNTAKELKL